MSHFILLVVQFLKQYLKRLSSLFRFSHWKTVNFRIFPMNRSFFVRIPTETLLYSQPSVIVAIDRVETRDFAQCRWLAGLPLQMHHAGIHAWLSSVRFQ